MNRIEKSAHRSENSVPDDKNAQNAWALAKKYEDKACMTQIQHELAVLEKSFALVRQHETALGNTFDELEELYEDAVAIANSVDLSNEQRRQSLYRIYDLYFEKLAPIPYILRVKVKIHKYMKQMRKVVKQGNYGVNTSAFWREFAVKCGVSFAVFFSAEILLLWVLDEGSPVWLRALLWIVFGVSISVYCYYAYALEGRRIFLQLQKWLGFKARPAEFDKPMDIWQYAKLAAPFAVAVSSALAKLYILQ